MNFLKRILDTHVPHLIQKFGYFVNPIILNNTNENNHLLIFYFHGLYESATEKNLAHVDPQNNLLITEFIEFIDYFLSHEYIFIKPEDLLGQLSNDQRYIMITFDDGYYNNALAVKVLNRYQIPAVFFITTKNILDNTSFWWDVVYKFRTKEMVSLEKIRNEQQYLKHFKYSFIENYIHENFGGNAYIPWSDIDRPFNTLELQTISKDSLVCIGNHTHNHSILTIYNQEEIKQEFSKSGSIFLELLGYSPKSIAFPNGNHNKEILRITEDAGFQFAFTTKNNINTLPIANENMACLDRFMVKTIPLKRYITFARLNYTPEDFYLKLIKKVKRFKI